ncbi:putative calcium binding protein [Streptomyces viridochromogenes Tue57]|uniref:Putative calcium binding protein n=2 Tax=Streptomyces viridochromogenes TaxID=1938 RepID=L8PHD3_STRVR|nr:putative calcium binding protein [Streptomyces viridochromogenes Tue57]
MSELQDEEPAESSSEVTRRSVLRGTAGLTVGAAAFLVSGPEATAASGSDIAPTPAEVASQLAAAKIAADQNPLLRHKQLRAFELLDVDGDGFVTKADTVSLARRFAAFTEGGVDGPMTGQLIAAIGQMWNALVAKPKWVPDTGRLSPQDFVVVMANSVAVTPDKTLQYIGLITNLTFTMADADGDGVLQREDAIRLGMAAANETREEAETGWKALVTADPERATYAEVLLAVTDFVTGVNPASPSNLALGRL